MALQKGVRNFLPGFPFACTILLKYDFDIYCALILIWQEGTVVNLPFSDLVNFHAYSSYLFFQDYSPFSLSLSLSHAFIYFWHIPMMALPSHLYTGYTLFINSLTPFIIIAICFCSVLRAFVMCFWQLRPCTDILQYQRYIKNYYEQVGSIYIYIRRKIFLQCEVFTRKMILIVT